MPMIQTTQSLVRKTAAQYLVNAMRPGGMKSGDEPNQGTGFGQPHMLVSSLREYPLHYSGVIAMVWSGGNAYLGSEFEYLTLADA